MYDKVIARVFFFVMTDEGAMVFGQTHVQIKSVSIAFPVFSQYKFHLHVPLPTMCRSIFNNGRRSCNVDGTNCQVGIPKTSN